MKITWKIGNVHFLDCFWLLERSRSFLFKQRLHVHLLWIIDFSWDTGTIQQVHHSPPLPKIFVLTHWFFFWQKMSFASFWSLFVGNPLFLIVMFSVAEKGKAYSSVLVFSAFSTIILGVFFFFWLMEGVEHQKPENMMIGMLGIAFWLTLFFIGCVSYQYDVVVSKHFQIKFCLITALLGKLSRKSLITW